jgi:ABC-type glutathione transport system ATPase component
MATNGQSTVQPVLQARHISKRFGSVTALEDVDFELYPDEILALVGDNGAGKSTLIKILSGAYQPDSGEILMDGQRVEFKNPMDAPPRHRDCLPGPGPRRGTRYRQQPLPGPRGAQRWPARRHPPPAG